MAAALTFTSYPGAGEELSNLLNYSQAVSIPASATFIKVAGQGGWSASSFSDIPPSAAEQVKNAFDNVERALKAAGVERALKAAGVEGGWGAVHQMRSYSVDLAGTVDLIAAETRKRCVDHRPTWTAVGVSALASQEMLVEIEVEAVVQAK
ncbi:hypothetical protein JCM6882_006128 [Rhodosporidiobolus microsporus]